MPFCRAEPEWRKRSVDQGAWNDKKHRSSRQTNTIPWVNSASHAALKTSIHNSTVNRTGPDPACPAGDCKSCQARSLEPIRTSTTLWSCFDNLSWRIANLMCPEEGRLSQAQVCHRFASASWNTSLPTPGPWYITSGQSDRQGVPVPEASLHIPTSFILKALLSKFGLAVICSPTGYGAWAKAGKSRNVQRLVTEGPLLLT